MLFVFRRPVHTARVLESLALNAELEHSELIVYCEGARNDGEREAVAATRRLVRAHARAGIVRIIERDQNLGCAASILAGINDVLGTHDRIIVLEQGRLSQEGTHEQLLREHGGIYRSFYEQQRLKEDLESYVEKAIV